MRAVVIILTTAGLLISCLIVHAWNSPALMVSAAIAYSDLKEWSHSPEQLPEYGQEGSRTADRAVGDSTIQC